MTVSSDQRKKTKAIPLSENFQSRALTKRLLHKTAMERTEIIRARKAIHHPSMKLSGTRAFECILKVKFVFCFMPNHCWAMDLLSRMQKTLTPFEMSAAPSCPFYLLEVTSKPVSCIEPPKIC